MVLPGSDDLVAPSHWSFGQLTAITAAPAAYQRQLLGPLAAINLKYGLTSHQVKQIKTLETHDGRVEFRVVSVPDCRRIDDHKLVYAVPRIADNGNSNSRQTVVRIYPERS